MQREARQGSCECSGRRGGGPVNAARCEGPVNATQGSPGADLRQQTNGSHDRAAAIPGRREGGVNGETALLWQQHGLHRLHHLLCDGELVQGQGLDGSEVMVQRLALG